MRAALLLLAAPLLAAPVGRAQTAPRVTRVLELFTSQGCPKCPAADRLIGVLARAPDTVALSFAVNTWDFGGWVDTLAQPASGQRQRAYARGRGDGLAYTPQVVVDGVAALPGGDRVAIEGAALRSTALADVPVELDETDGRLTIAVGAAPKGGTGPVGIFLLRVARTTTVAIGRGDNSGRSVTYTNVVRAMRKIGDWTGPAAHFELTTLRAADEGYVVLLQTGTPDKLGPILAAAKTPDL